MVQEEAYNWGCCHSGCLGEPSSNPIRVEECRLAASRAPCEHEISRGLHAKVESSGNYTVEVIDAAEVQRGAWGVGDGLGIRPVAGEGRVDAVAI